MKDINKFMTSKNIFGDIALHINFENFKRLLQASFIVYVDFESILKSATYNKKDGLNKKKHQDHIIWSYYNKLICLDKKYSKIYKSYFGVDAVDKFIDDITSECEYY